MSPKKSGGKNQGGKNQEGKKGKKGSPKGK